MKRTILTLATTCGLAFTAFAADTIPQGTQVVIRNNDPIRLNNPNNYNGQVYTGVVDNDVADNNGNLVIPRGSNAELLVRRVNNNEMVIDLDSITVNGHRYAVQASEQTREGRDSVGGNRRTGEYVGGGAVLGTILGAIAGGGRGAAIGAASGAAVGAGTQVMTRGHQVNVPPESLMTFRLERPLYVDVRDSGVDRNGHHYHTDWNRYDNNNNNRPRDDRQPNYRQ